MRKAVIILIPFLLVAIAGGWFIYTRLPVPVAAFSGQIPCPQPECRTVDISLTFYRNGSYKDIRAARAKQDGKTLWQTTDTGNWSLSKNNIYTRISKAGLKSYFQLDGTRLRPLDPSLHPFPDDTFLNRVSGS